MQQHRPSPSQISNLVFYAQSATAVISGQSPSQAGSQCKWPHLKRLAHADLAIFLFFLQDFLLLFYVQFLCSINFCFALLKYANLRLTVV